MHPSVVAIHGPTVPLPPPRSPVVPKSSAPAPGNDTIEISAAARVKQLWDSGLSVISIVWRTGYDEATVLRLLGRR